MCSQYKQCLFFLFSTFLPDTSPLRSGHCTPLESGGHWGGTRSAFYRGRRKERWVCKTGIASTHELIHYIQTTLSFNSFILSLRLHTQRSVLNALSLISLASHPSSSASGSFVALDSFDVPQNTLVHLILLPFLLEMHRENNHCHDASGPDKELLGHTKRVDDIYVMMQSKRSC